jgi:hypothetical protein
MLARAFGGWVLILLVAVINGGIREALIIPRTNEAAGHAISTISLCAAILVMSWLIIGWIRPTTVRAVWRIAAMWVALTLAFEFLAGHYLFGTPWRQLLADYNIFRGRTWVLVLITTAIAPWLSQSERPLASDSTVAHDLSR